jgi:hypothetical protein
MGKRGLVFYGIMSLPIALVGYLTYYNYKQFKDFDITTITQDPETKQKYRTSSEIRKMGERSKSEKVPPSDQSSGYM